MKYYVDVRVHEIVPETKLNLFYMASELYYEYCDSGVENQIKEVWKCRSDKEVEYVLPVENYGTDKETDLRMAYLMQLEKCRCIFRNLKFHIAGM